MIDGELRRGTASGRWLCVQYHHGVLGRGYPREQTSEQLPAQVGEGLHSSDGEAAWNDHHGRDTAVQERRQGILHGLRDALLVPRHLEAELRQTTPSPAAGGLRHGPAVLAV